MSAYDLTLRLIELVYAAGAAPERWPLFLEALADATRSDLVGLVAHDFGSHDGGTSWAVRLDPEGARLYNDHYHQHDPWAGDLSKYVVGQVVLGQSVNPPALVRRTSYYHEFARKYGCVSMLGVPLERSPRGLPSFLSCNRGHRKDAFDAREASLMTLLAPHAVRAVAIQRRLGGAASAAQALEDALDRITTGLILLAPSGSVVFCNRAAGGIAARGDGLLIGPDGVSAVDPHAAKTLRGHIAGASATAVSEGFHSGGAVRVARTSGRPPYEVLVTPLRLRAADDATCPSTVALFVSDPDGRSETDVERLGRAFHLTPGEARVAAALAAGESVDQIAQACRLTREITRWSVKQVLHKVGAATQAGAVRQLAARLMTPPP